ncbi:MAG: hypothetical protein DRJ69_01620 [Thermoprotei archaeon]|nr:MAG: hypothetical protein DRJ69_01620 [Thermoprotei archaeon]
MNPLARRRGVSEVVGALLLTFITLTFMSVIALQLISTSKSGAEGYVNAIRADRARLLESLTLISADFQEGVTLWLFNPSSQPVRIVEVDVEGSRFKLAPPVEVQPSSVTSIHLELDWLNGSSYVFLVRTLSGGLYKFEASP